MGGLHAYCAPLRFSDGLPPTHLQAPSGNRSAAITHHYYNPINPKTKSNPMPSVIKKIDANPHEWNRPTCVVSWWPPTTRLRLSKPIECEKMDHKTIPPTVVPGKQTFRCTLPVIRTSFLSRPGPWSCPGPKIGLMASAYGATPAYVVNAARITKDRAVEIEELGFSREGFGMAMGPDRESNLHPSSIGTWFRIRVRIV